MLPLLAQLQEMVAVVVGQVVVFSNRAMSLEVEYTVLYRDSLPTNHQGVMRIAEFVTCWRLRVTQKTSMMIIFTTFLQGVPGIST